MSLCMRSGCRGGAVITAGLLLAACAQLPRPVSENSTLPSAAFPDPPHRLVQEGESPVIGGLGRAQVADGQTLVDLARRFDLGFDEMQQANPDLDMWVPPSQAQVVLSNRHLLPRAPRTGIVINLAARRLFWFEGEGVRTHPIGIGRSGWETPLARTRVTAKAQDPPWRVPASVRREHAQAGDPLPAVVPPGPDNPLGRHVLRLALPSYLIHGTNKPDGVGMRVSHGCIRMYPEDIAALYRDVPVGTPVQIVDQPWLAGWHGNTLYFEAHRPLPEADEAAMAALRAIIAEALAQAPPQADPMVWARVLRVAQQARGMPLAVSAGSAPVDEQLAGLPAVALPAAPASPAESAASPDAVPQEVAPQIAAAGWFVQVASFIEAGRAEQLAARITAADATWQARIASSGPWHRLQIGPYPEREQAQAVLRQVHRALDLRGLVVSADG